MTGDIKALEGESVAMKVRELIEAKNEAEASVADCLKQMAAEEQMLASVLSRTKTPETEEYLELSAEACRAGIKAWEASIVAYEHDINAYKSEIDTLSKLLN